MWSWLPDTLDEAGVLSLKAAFIFAGALPVVLVLLYRAFRVPARLAEIANVMNKAFGKKGDPDRTNTKEQNEARQALDNNPYISDLDIAFERCHNWRDYAVPLVVLTVLTAALAALAYAWIRIKLQPWEGGPVSRIPLVMIMALAGGYVWSVYQVIARCSSDEMGPEDLVEIDFGLLAAGPIGYAFSLLGPSDLAAFGAFAASAFPLSEVKRLIKEQVLKRTINAPAAPAQTRVTERHLGTAIDGVSDQALVRLSELRINTVLDMAYSDPIRIMVQTGYALPLVIDWMDQSLWALYAGDARGTLVKYGIRCSLDVYEFVEIHDLSTPDGTRGTPQGGDRAALESLAARLEIPSSFLHDLMLRIYADPQVVVLRRLWYVTGGPSVLGKRQERVKLPPTVSLDVVEASDLSTDTLWWTLYEASFPPTERDPRSVIQATIEKGAGFVIRARAANQTIGLAVATLLPDVGATFLVYLAVRPEWRSWRVGSALFEKARAIGADRLAALGDRPAGMIWEIDDPKDTTDAQEVERRVRRLRFFERLGGVTLPGRYVQPAVDGKNVVNMQLMFRPEPGAAVPSGADYARVVRAVYFGKYQALNEIPKDNLEQLLVTLQ